MDPYGTSGTAVTVVPSVWTTPRRLRAYLGAAWVAAVLLFAVCLQALRSDRTTIQIIARRAAPNIIASEELGAHLADIDTELANSLLGTAQDRDLSNRRLEQQRLAANRRLIDAASASVQGEKDREPVVTMMNELERYYELAARARWLQEKDGEEALASLRLATQRMHEVILQAAARLDAADRSLLDLEYDRSSGSSRLYEAEAIICELFLAATLVAAQAFVRRRMRRRIVPALLAATLLSIAFTVFAVNRFHAARENLRVARDDAFNSIHLLWRATSLAYDARGDESRWLLDRAHATDYEVAFRAKTRQILSEPGAWLVGSSDVQSGRITGLLVDEARNVTFGREGHAVEVAMLAFSHFVAVDDALRAAAAKGNFADASERCIGSTYDGSRATFDRFDAALADTIAINQEAFDQAVADSDRGLARAEWLDPAFALAIALLIWLGIRPRLREYP
jgi:hypothetical protein